MELKKGNIDGQLKDIVSSEEYNTNKNLYEPEFTAIEREDFVYPIRTRIDTKPGYYPQGPIVIYKQPLPEQESIYSINNIIDFSKTNNMKDLIEQSSNLKEMERQILTTPDNIYRPIIDEEDEPEMEGLKEAVIAKNIDIYKYKHRFPQFNNDIREFDKHSTTLSKLKRFGNALDLKITLVIEDKDPNVANPMGIKIIKPLNGEDGE